MSGHSEQTAGPTGRFFSDALQQVQRVQKVLPALGVDFEEAQEAAQGEHLRWLSQGIRWLRGAENGDLAELQGILPPDRLTALRETLQRIETQAAPQLAQVSPDSLQLGQLLLLLLTRRLHLGEVLLFALEGGPPPSPRSEMHGVDWQSTAHRHHATTRQALRLLIVFRDSQHCNRRVPEYRLPVHLGWVEQGGESMLEDLLSGRSPLYLHQVFEVLLLLEVPIRRFVEILYLVEAGTVGTSQEQLSALVSGDRPPVG